MKKSLFALACGTLGLGISEFGMMSILSEVANSFQISIDQAGNCISAYAIGVCFGALALAFLARNHSLKTLLITLLAIMCLGNMLAVFANTYEIMIAARFISGLPHGGYFGIAGIAAKRLAAKGEEVAAVAIMISGMTVANLLGIPLASYLTHVISWHVLFVVVVLWGCWTIYAVYSWVPLLPVTAAANIKSQFQFLKNPLPWLLLATIMFGNGGTFCWYSYINPIMINTVGFPFYYMAGIMMLAGLGMVLGNYASGKLSYRLSPVLLTKLMLGCMCLAALLMIFVSDYPYAALGIMFLGVFGLFGVSGPEQYLIIETSKGGEVLGASSAQVAFNLGNALGAFFGGLPIAMGFPVQYSAVSGIIFGCCGLITVHYFGKRWQKDSAIES